MMKVMEQFGVNKLVMFKQSIFTCTNIHIDIIKEQNSVHLYKIYIQSNTAEGMEIISMRQNISWILHGVAGKIF